jgi:putative transposase
MAEYRRAHCPGGTFFFTVVTYDRQPFLCDPKARQLLCAVIERCRGQWPFEIHAMKLKPLAFDSLPIQHME